MEIQIYKRVGNKVERDYQSAEINEPIELGRRRDDSESLYQFIPTSDVGCARLVIAGKRETTVGRRHVLLEPLPNDRVRITNISSKSTVQFENGDDLARNKPKEYVLLDGGLVVRLGDERVIRVSAESPNVPDNLYPLDYPSVPPGEVADEKLLVSTPASPGAPLDTAQLARLQIVLGVLQSTLGSEQFFPRAARAVVTVADMDEGHVLLWKNNDWNLEASDSRDPVETKTPKKNFSKRVLNRIQTTKRTFFELPTAPGEGSHSGVKAVVAAPILNQQGQVIGALYGDRRVDGPRVTPMDALLVEIIASAVSNGLERLKYEQTALCYEQFFAPQLVRHLSLQPNLLEGKKAHVTVLFCDVRKFSRFSEKLGPAKTMRWINEVMEELSACVTAHEGVLVDYIGDELMAMWGAPEEQADHASRACRAALMMLDKLPQLNLRWQRILGEPMDFGIGTNSGEALVGNTGSTRKFKYGPLGNTVNIASRVQGATKHLRARFLITETTWNLLDKELRSQSRRLCCIRVVNIEKPVTLYEIAPVGQHRPAWKVHYERALEAFERGDFRIANLLDPLYDVTNNDGPSIVLLARAVQALAHGPLPDHPVLVLDSK
jgi:adenylate cyclase